jgi:SAM-dependent methyltransferase
MEPALYAELAQREENHWWFRARREIVWSLLKKHVDGGAERRLRICELGCGTGGNLTALAWNHEVVGVECSELALAYARRRLGDRVRRGSLPDDVDLPRDAYDVVLLTDVLEHIEDDAQSASTALRLAKPGGIVIATVPAYQWLYSPRDEQHHHFRRYGKRQFRALWQFDETRIELLSYYNTLLFPAAACIRLASKLSTGKRPATGDLELPSPMLNRLLARALASERRLLGRMPLPFGLSLVTVVRKGSVSALLRTAV